MPVVPTLILPHEDELETLGRLVERTLSRSVRSIDVIGRGTLACVPALRLSQRVDHHHHFGHPDPLSRVSTSS
jgi:hypothetical protein